MIRWTTLVLAALVLFASAAQAQMTKRVLTADVAEKMAQACEDYQKKQKDWRTMNIAILDDAGDLLFFRRDPTSFRGSIKVAIDKAWTSTQFPMSTRDIGEKIVNREAGKIHGFQFMERVISFPGGVPIFMGGQHVGAIGVSGATGDQDEECALKAIEAVKDMLK